MPSDAAAHTPNAARSEEGSFPTRGVSFPCRLNMMNILLGCYQAFCLHHRHDHGHRVTCSPTSGSISYIESLFDVSSGRLQLKKRFTLFKLACSFKRDTYGAKREEKDTHLACQISRINSRDPWGDMLWSDPFSSPVNL